MPWNEPGSDKPNNSGANGSANGGNNGANRGGTGRGRSRSSNDVEDILKNIKESFGGGGSGSGKGGGDMGLPSWFTLPVILIGLAVFVGFRSIYTVKEGQESVVLTFGEYSRTDTAGLNFAWWPVQTKYQYDVKKLRTVEVGYRGSQTQPKEALMLTNDENIVDVTMAVQYTIKDLQMLLFNVGDLSVDGVVRGATESALREVVGSKTMDDLLTKGRREVDINTKDVLQTILDLYKTGIQIESIEIQDAKPPAQVSDAFDDVVKADQDKIRKVNDAQAYANDLIPKARGEASRITQEAEAYKETIVAQATGEAERFNQVLTEYQKAPEVTKKRLYIETMEEVLGNTNKVMVDGNNGNSLMYLPIDKLIEGQRNAAPANANTRRPATQNTQRVTNQRTPIRSTNREGR